MLSEFIMQYDTTPAFATRNGMPLGQLTVPEDGADASIAVVSQSYRGSSNPILRRRIMIDNADVISQGIIGPGSMVVIDGLQLTVSTVNADSCGVTCLTQFIVDPGLRRVKMIFMDDLPNHQRQT